MRPGRLVAVALALCATVGVAQTRPESDDAFKRAFDASRGDDYLAAVDLWRPLALTPDGAVRDEQAWSQWAEAVGRITGEPPPHPVSPTASTQTDADRTLIVRIERAEARDAIREIVARARKTRVVILNEYHIVPRSRAFALEVARALRPLGYDVLAAETFGNDPDPARYAPNMARLVADGYVRRGTGYYTRDPVFASFVREALALGYRPVAYESTVRTASFDPVDSINVREQSQTDHLLQRAIRAYPESKILIFVGHGHVAELPTEWEPGVRIPWMAARLKAASGIDPLTIDQTEFLRPAPDRTGVTAAYIARADRRSIVLIDRAGPVRVGKTGQAVDLQVAHPRLAPVAGRPGWLAALGRTPVPIPSALHRTGGRRLVQAYPAGAAADAVPIDQVLVEAGRPPPVLMLDQRPYDLRVQDQAPAATDAPLPRR